MTRAGLALVALLAAACAPVGYESARPAGVDPAVITDVHARLDEARWDARLLVFSAPSGHADLARMRERVASDPAGLADRDLTVAWLAGPDGTFGDTPLAPTAVATLRAATDLPPDAFGGVLIGKDGGIKDRYAAPVELAEAFALIDTMPMRRREMRDDG